MAVQENVLRSYLIFAICDSIPGIPSVRYGSVLWFRIICKQFFVHQPASQYAIISHGQNFDKPDIALHQRLVDVFQVGRLYSVS